MLLHPRVYGWTSKKIGRYSFHKQYNISIMVNCHEFVMTSEFGVYSTFVDTESLKKKFDEGPLPRTMPTIPARIRTRINKAQPERTFDESHRFKDLATFIKFFEEDIEDTPDAVYLIDAVLKELDPVHSDIPMEDGLPEGVTIVSRSTRREV
jgi:hypothetical protein